MDLDLSYTDYSVVGLTLPNTLKLLPSTGTKSGLKVVTGDQDGVLQVCSFKNDEIQLNFKTLPGEPITSVHLGGSAQGGLADKIFISSGTEVRGYTKKGKLFLSLETNLAEPIIAMWVHEADLLVAGTHCVTHYRDCKEVGSYLCGDKIIDLAAIQLPNSSRLVGVVSCGGGAIRAVERGRALATGRLPAGPRILCGPPQPRPPPYLLCGTDSGSLHSVSLDKEHGSILIQDFSGIECAAGVTAIGWWEGGSPVGSVPLCLIARSDGLVQIYRLQPEEPQQTAQLLFSHRCGESVTSIWGWSGGIVAATRTGRLFGLTPSVSSATAAARFQTLKGEVEELEARVEKERSRYRTATQPLSQGLSAIPALQISEEWGPVEGDGARRVCVSLGAPLDTLLLQSSAPLQLLDAAPNTALLTRACDPENSNSLLATYRCQANTQRLEMRVGAIKEGLAAAGDLRIYVTPLLQPKCSQLLIYHIPPLSWHVSIQDIDSDREYNTLSVKGAFSRAEVHAWLARLLPDIPSRPPASNDPLVLCSVITDTFLYCSYQKGEADFKSDNVTTISIVKDFLSLEATKKKVRLDISCNVNDDTIISTIKKLHPKIEESSRQIKENKLLDALSELEINSTDMMLDDKLCKEYADAIRRPPASTEQNKQPNLSQLHDVIADLFVDRNKLKGINVKSKLPQLKELLENYNLDTLLTFFKTIYV